MKAWLGNNLKEDEKDESVDTLLLDVSFMAHRHAHAMGQRLLTTDGRMVGHMFGSFKQIKSVSADTILNPCRQKPKAIKDFKAGDHILGIDSDGQTIETEVVALHDHGILEGYEAEFDDGYKIVCSANHKFLTVSGMVALKDIWLKDMEVFYEPTEQSEWLARKMRLEVGVSTEVARTSQGLPTLPGGREDGSVSLGVGGQETVPNTGGLVSNLWPDLSNETNPGQPPKPLSELSGDPVGSAAQEHYELAGSKSGCPEGSMRGNERNLCTTDKGGPLEGGRTQEEVLSRSYKVADGQSRDICCQHAQSLDRSQAIQDGGLAKVFGNPDLVRGQHQVFGEAEAGGLCIARPQDLGGGGRVLSLLRGVSEETSTSDSPVQGCDVELGGVEASGRDANTIVGRMLQRNRTSSGRMASMAYSDAPLTSTGGLVLRRIVRIRAVGLRHMYDLEVSHSRHNFLLPNGVVTSNSFIGTFHPRRLAFVYDRGCPWRRALVPSYKQSRRPPDDGVKHWSPGPEVERLLRSFPGYHLSLDDFEADDMACWFTRNVPYDVKGPILIYSGDRDLWQLVNDKNKVAALVTKKPPGPRSKSKNIWVREDMVKAEFGVEPRALAKIKALLGDSSDEIHGLRGAVRPGKKDILRGFADDALSDMYFDPTKAVAKNHLPVPEPFQDALLAERQDMLNNYRIVNLDLAQVPTGSNPIHVEKGNVAAALDVLVEFECESLLAQVEPLFQELVR